eukprot:263905_1
MALQILNELISTIDSPDLIINKGETVELKSDELYVFNNITIKENGILTTKNGGKLFLKILNNLILENNASINLNYLGYPSDEGIGKGIDGGGGSYCTKGGEGWNTGNAGKLYGDTLNMGSGGGTWGSFDGGAGGGYIDIQINKNGKLILNDNSNICANGENGQDTEYVYASGSGSGGCINITCDSIKSIIINSKTALISAIGGKGGVGRCYTGGDGGNGKIQINVNQYIELDNDIMNQIVPKPNVLHTK